MRNSSKCGQRLLFGPFEHAVQVDVEAEKPLLAGVVEEGFHLLW